MLDGERYKVMPSEALITKADGSLLKIKVLLVFDRQNDLFEAVVLEGSLKGASIAVTQGQLKQVRDGGVPTDLYPKVEA